MTLARIAPAVALLAALTVLAVLLLREGHRDHTRPGHGRTRPHSRDVGTDRQDHDALEGDPIMTQPTRLAPDHTVWSVWMEDSNSGDGVSLYLDEQTALASAAADWTADEYGQPDPDQDAPNLTWTKPYSQWQLADGGRDTRVRAAEVSVYRPAMAEEIDAQDAERARREAEYAALPRMSMAEALEALVTAEPTR